jgi:acyl carrier protein
MQNKSQLIDLIESILEIKVDSNSSMDNTPEWDSVAHVEIVLALQSKYSVKVPYHKIALITSVSKIENFLQETSHEPKT